MGKKRVLTYVSSLIIIFFFSAASILLLRTAYLDKSFFSTNELIPTYLLRSYLLLFAYIFYLLPRNLPSGSLLRASALPYNIYVVLFFFAAYFLAVTSSRVHEHESQRARETHADIRQSLQTLVPNRCSALAKIR